MILVLTGVAGSGKTTIGQRLSIELGWPFFDADDFHPPANVEKMSRGIPLTDDDRWPWLRNLRRRMQEEEAGGRHAIFACSALKASYRSFLREGGDVQCIYLKGDPALIRDRLDQRPGHFMKPQMLESQFAALEEPADCLTVDIRPPPEEVTAAIRQKLTL